MLAPPTPQWAADFEQEADSITNALSPLAIELHHIGSTAIRGIVAKPVIDILGVVSSLDAVDARAERVQAIRAARGDMAPIGLSVPVE